jgi:uncharacterized LabA/DUF88 family protein
MRTNIYVDGFNLYFGALKGTPHKWLNIYALAQMLLRPANKIQTIKYFTANVSGTAIDPDKALHQQLYIRALLASYPALEVIRGQFRSHEVVKPLVTPFKGQKYVKVIDRTEKGSDVNLAVHLLNDAWRNEYDCAVVVSGDSDLAESIRLVREYHPKKPIGVWSPGRRSMSKELITASSFIRQINASALAACQFPAQIPGTTINKPADW